MANFTKNAIKDTFLKLLDEMPLSQISVKMLVEECGINRNTFYYHYADIPALIEEIVTGEAERIIAQYPTIDTLRDGLSAVLEFASANRRSLLHIYNSVNRDIFERYLWKVCDHIVEAYGVNALKGMDIVPLDREIMKRFYKCECFDLPSNGWTEVFRRTTACSWTASANFRPELWRRWQKGPKSRAEAK